MAKNANGQGGISYDKSRNTYMAYITDPQGNRIFERFKSKQDAEQWLTLTRAEIYKNTYITPSNITL